MIKIRSFVSSVFAKIVAFILIIACNPCISALNEQLKNEFLATAQSFISMRSAELCQAAWLPDEPSSSNQQPQCFRFAQKVELSPGADVKFIADLHGQAQTLRDLIKQLKKEQWLEEGSNNSYKIKEKKDKIVFLGDMVDRGPESLAALNMILKLSTNNPGQVIILKGNHEAADIFLRYGFGQEVDYHPQILMAAQQSFNFLPSACYLTWHKQDTDEQQCVLCTHGGPDINYTPERLLNNDSYDHELIKPNNTRMVNSLYTQAIQQQIAEQQAENSSFDLCTWTDFDHHNQTAAPSFNAGRLKLSLATLTEYWKDIQMHTPAIKPIGIIRGHQHGSMAHELEHNNGVYLLHSNTQFTEPSKKISTDELIRNESPFVLTVGMGLQRVVLTMQLDRESEKCILSRKTIR
jgi:predicted MPP superfamily phosphohydrolase